MNKKKSKHPKVVLKTFSYGDGGAEPFLAYTTLEKDFVAKKSPQNHAAWNQNNKDRKITHESSQSKKVKDISIL